MLWTWLEQAIHYPLPTWQPALGLLAVIAFFFSPWSNSSELMQAAEPIYVYKTDTVYSSTTDTIYKERATAQSETKAEVKRSKRTVNPKNRSVATAANVVRTRNDASTKTVDVPDKAEIPEAIVAFHLDTTMLRQNSDAWMSRDSGHSLNEVEGIMDFFVEIHWQTSAIFHLRSFFFSKVVDLEVVQQLLPILVYAEKFSKYGDVDKTP